MKYNHTLNVFYSVVESYYCEPVIFWSPRLSRESKWITLVLNPR